MCLTVETSWKPPAPAPDVQASVIPLAATVGAVAEDSAIRPFRINVPEEALVDLRRRVAATRWSARETVSDQSQGVRLAKIQALVHYWGTDYDWRKVEAKLNALPQFVTEMPPGRDARHTRGTLRRL